MSFLNSRKVSWIIFGITLLTAVVSLFFLPDIIPVHFGILDGIIKWEFCYFRFCNFSFCF